MKKFELVCLLLAEGLAKTQLELSRKLGISLSTVNHALEPLRRMGAVEVKRSGIVVLDKRKLLSYWASVHKQKIVYSTRVESVVEAEKLVPNGVLFASFAAFKRLFGREPSDYSETYLYAGGEALEEVKKRFPPSEKKSNFFVFHSPDALFSFGRRGCVPPSLVFVDLWNNKEWYAAEFLKALEGELFG